MDEVGELRRMRATLQAVHNAVEAVRRDIEVVVGVNTPAVAARIDGLAEKLQKKETNGHSTS